MVYWGFSELGGLAQWLLGLGTPLLAAVLWGRFVAPKASHPQVDPTRLGLEVAGLAVLHLGLTFALGQRLPQPVP